MKSNTPDVLRELYAESSKHSSYQRLAPSVARLVGEDFSAGARRYEAERWAYVSAAVDFADRQVADVGANTGYFTFRSIEEGAKEASVYEGNANHCQLVACAAGILGLSGRIHVHNRYVEFTSDSGFEPVDACFLLNVLHHYGDDYGSKISTQVQAREHIARALKCAARRCRTIIFQLGFNQKGDRNRPLFEQGSKQEMIEFVRHSCLGHLEVERIGIPWLADDRIVYQELNEQNIERKDSLGEFLNRPIFVLKSTVVSG